MLNSKEVLKALHLPDDIFVHTTFTDDGKIYEYRVETISFLAMLIRIGEDAIGFVESPYSLSPPIEERLPFLNKDGLEYRVKIVGVNLTSSYNGLIRRITPKDITEEYKMKTLEALVDYFKIDKLKLDEKGDNKMKNTNGMMNFGAGFKGIKGFEKVGMVNGLLGFSLFSNTVAVKIGNKMYSYEEGSLVDNTGFTMDLPMPALVMPAKRAELKEGDIIYDANGELTFVKTSGPQFTTTIGEDGEEKRIVKVSNPVMKDFDYVAKVTSPFTEMLSDGNDLFDNPMMAMMMFGGGDQMGLGTNDNPMQNMMMMMAMGKMMK